MAEMNAAQRRILEQSRARQNQEANDLFGGSPVNADAGVAPTERLRTFAQGVTFGWGDELEAMLRSMVPNAIGGRDYDVIRDEVRKKLSDYQQQNPAESITLEIAGAIIPSVLASILSGGTAAPAALTGLARTAQIGKVAAGESLIAAAGYSEGDSPRGVTQDAALGTTIGTAAGVGLDAVTRGAGGLVGLVRDFTRRKFGDKADSAVHRELLRLAESTGLTVDEVVQAVAEGRVVADNATLGLAIKSMVNEGGETRAAILGQSGARAATQQQAAQEAVRGSLTPDASDINVVRAQRQTENELRREQSAAYDQVFGGAGPLSQDVADQMLNIIQRVPDAARELAELYSAKNLVPLFRQMPNGEIQFVRAPNLEDSELLRRVLADKKREAFQGSRGAMGEVFSEMEGGLRKQIDTASPELGATRAAYAARMAAKDAFELGQKRGLTMNVDELTVIVGNLSGEALSAFRAGVMDAINNRARRSGKLIRDLANEDKQIGAALRVVLPKEDLARVSGTLDRAAAAIEQHAFIQPRAGSPTQGMAQEAAARGRGPITPEDALRGGQGDIFAMVRMLRNIIPSGKGMSQEQMVQVVKVLYSESPELVEAALKDKSQMGALLRRAESIAQTLSTGGRVAAEQQAVQAVQ